MLQKSLVPFVESLKEVPGIIAIVIGGSRARGTGDASSDTDLGLYYDPEIPIDVAVLDRVAAAHDDRRQSGLVTPIGGWGRWINGGGWLRVNGAPVDLLYRDTSKVGSVTSDAMQGRFEVVYLAGHPLGFLSSIYLGEVAVCNPLWDPNGWIANTKSKIASYPDPLRREQVRRFGFDAKFCLEIAAKPALRSDATYIAGCLFNAIGSLLLVLFALNRTYWLNEKGALAIADKFEIVPVRLGERITQIWTAFGADSKSLIDAIRIAHDLNQEVAALVKQQGLEC